MKRLLLILVLGLFLPAGAQAACYLEYKAKKDAPLRLHYGVMQIDDGGCPGANRAQNIAERRLDGTGWTLLTVVGLSEQPPSDQKRANAGEYFLRY
ncbi:hypothetical protein KUH32_04450 [Thalassococcus sp. CAU 1522]|uniref:Uncharacterized protein n=1 Tax=Thalassococcus arenae TaxID=2851652 RepID=A0ABS6N4U0_9RHOB|nr:hypothetical protein [Thalassococcus arenae]MBV2359017.1 hypothetical protein [Thalassococcus arenae]